MYVRIGGIYEVSEEWHPYDTSIFNHRPVIVLSQYGDNVEVVLMGAIHQSSNKQNWVMIEVEINGKKHISAIACDVVHQVPIKFIKTNIGYVNNDIIDLIKNKRNTHIQKKSDMKIQTNVQKRYEKKIREDVIITEKQKFLSMMLNIQEDTKKVREISEKTTTSLYVWKERGVGFLFGILASIVANFIWDVRLDVWNTIIEYVNQIIVTLTGSE